MSHVTFFLRGLGEKKNGKKKKKKKKKIKKNEDK